MNTVIKQRNSRPIDRKRCKEFSTQFSLPEILTELIMLKGVETAEQFDKFVHPSPQNLYDPFLMKDMQAAVKRIEQAIENEENVVVYGDYDVDGVCSTAILTLYLSSRGLNVFAHIPNRNGEGYGLNEKSLSKIIEQSYADLIITCDCGISGRNEVAFCAELGVDVIVTDHHEVPESTPECLIINPKQKECAYPDKMLAGAGVVFKLIHALGGLEVAMEYVELACVATVADMVPLLDENRLIVQLGLKELKHAHNIGLKLLLKNQKIATPTSGDISYKLAPRINAAGRMGDAFRAFQLLTSSDTAEILTIIEELNAANDCRKDLCETMYAEALVEIEQSNLSCKRAIILRHDEWEKGITGILAARVAHDFRRPTFILVRSGDAYKGTCRGIDGISVHEILRACAPLLIEFGGHAQAAGFSILPENIDDFKNCVEDFLKTADDEAFYPTAYFDVRIDDNDATIELAEALNVLEPTGTGNPKPLFSFTVGDLKVSACKNNAAHISAVTQNGLQIFAFSFDKQAYQLMGKEEKELVVELQTSGYDKPAAKAILRAVSPSKLYINDTAASGYRYEILKLSGEPRFKTYSPDELSTLIDGRIYGTLLIADTRACYESLLANYTPKIAEYMYPQGKNNYTKVVVSPRLASYSLGIYDRIILLFRPFAEGYIAALNAQTNAEIFCPDLPVEKPDASADRAAFGSYYSLISKMNGKSAQNAFSYFKKLSVGNSSLTFAQFCICAAVFNELGLINITESADAYQIAVVPGKKAELTDSNIYRLISGTV